MRRIRKRNILVVVGVAAVAAAFAIPAAAVKSSTAGLPTSIGPGEGRLNLIEWPSYAHTSWAKKFQRLTGCTIYRKDAGSSQEMFALMHANGGGGGGQYDLVSASGDASLRLIYANDVQEVTQALTGEFRKCADKAMQKTPNLDVKGVLELKVGADGKVTNAEAREVAPKDLATCVEKAGRGARFHEPKTGKGFTLRLPIVFRTIPAANP